MINYKNLIQIYIKKGRFKKGLSQKELAEKIGVIQGSISRWESGQSSPDTDVFFHVLEVLNIKNEFLMEIIDEKSMQEADLKKELLAILDDRSRLQNQKIQELENQIKELQKKIDRLTP